MNKFLVAFLVLAALLLFALLSQQMSGELGVVSPMKLR